MLSINVEMNRDLVARVAAAAGSGLAQRFPQQFHLTNAPEECMTELVKSFWKDDSGQGLAEYALLLGLIVIGVIVFIQGMGGHIKNLFGKANNELTTADM
jgi:pilus assembly protein Flp/PilA